MALHRPASGTPVFIGIRCRRQPGESEELVRKEGLEPSRCYPQVPETCASTSSATFAGRERLAGERLHVKEPVGTHRFQLICAGETPAPPAARLPVPPPSRGGRC